MKEVPKGYKKVDLILTFRNNKISEFEETVLRFLVRDFNICYTKKEEGGFTHLHFWCLPKKEVSLVYQMGCYAQKIFNFYESRDYFKKMGMHTVPLPYPESIYIDNSILNSCEHEPEMFFMGGSEYSKRCKKCNEDLD